MPNETAVQFSNPALREAAQDAHDAIREANANLKKDAPAGVFLFGERKTIEDARVEMIDDIIFHANGVIDELKSIQSRIDRGDEVDIEYEFDDGELGDSQGWLRNFREKYNKGKYAWAHRV